MVEKVMSSDQAIEVIVQRLGNLEKTFLIVDYAEGKDTGIIDILFVGTIDDYNLKMTLREKQSDIVAERFGMSLWTGKKY
jgi:hypothetical protein